jgi:hypothetical protein
LNEASKIKQEQFILNKMESQKKLKDKMLIKEGKMIIKKDK